FGPPDFGPDDSREPDFGPATMSKSSDSFVFGVGSSRSFSDSSNGEPGLPSFQGLGLNLVSGFLARSCLAASASRSVSSVLTKFSAALWEGAEGLLSRTSLSVGAWSRRMSLSLPMGTRRTPLSAGEGPSFEAPRRPSLFDEAPVDRLLVARSPRRTSLSS